METINNLIHEIMTSIINNLHNQLLYVAPSLFNAFWLILFQWIINTKSEVFKKEDTVNRWSINTAFTFVWIGLLASVLSPSVITWDIYLVRYGMTGLFTWAYFYHVKKFKKVLASFGSMGL